MKKFYPMVAMMAIAVVFSPLVCSAAEINEEDVTPRAKKIYLDTESQKSFFEKGKFKNIVGVSMGYDSNTHLDSRRDGDVFVQTYFKTNYSSPLNKKTTGILEYEFMNLLYTGESKLDLISTGIYAGIDNKINKDINFTAGYRFDVLQYINTGEDDFLDNQLEFKLKQKLPRNMYHSLAYELLERHFLRRYTRSTATLYTDKVRDDLRNTMGYEVGKYFPKDLLRLMLEYFNNNSDEKYLNYYDYNSYKIGASLTHLFSDKVFGYFAFYRQYRDFRSRTLSLDSNFREWDRTYVMSSSLYYNVNKSLTLGLNYAYRQNRSNEPLENYSGSLISVATYYRF